MKIIARDITNKDEYYAYKHGLRIISANKSMALANPITMEIEIEFDLTDSMSFYSKCKNLDELTINTKVFDSERDFRMTYFCSNLTK